MHDHAHEHRLEGDRRALAGALVIIGLGLMAGIVKTRQKDPAQ